MLSEISQKKKNTGLCHLYVELKKKKQLAEAETRMVVTRGQGYKVTTSR